MRPTVWRRPAIASKASSLLGSKAVNAVKLSFADNSACNADNASSCTTCQCASTSEMQHISSCRIKLLNSSVSRGASVLWCDQLGTVVATNRYRNAKYAVQHKERTDCATQLKNTLSLIRWNRLATSSSSAARSGDMHAAK